MFLHLNDLEALQGERRRDHEREAARWRLAQEARRADLPAAVPPAAGGAGVGRGPVVPRLGRLWVRLAHHPSPAPAADRSPAGSPCRQVPA